MSVGKREDFSKRKLNVGKVIILVIILLAIASGIIISINRDKIFKGKKEKDYAFQDKIKIEDESEKTIEEILSEFGGEVVETPKSDTYIVLKDEKKYTVYDDGEIVEGEVKFWSGTSEEPQIDEVGNMNIYSPEQLKWVADKIIKGEKNFAGITITLRASLDFGARIKEDGTWEGPVWTSAIGFLDEISKDEKKDEKKETTENETPKENLKRFVGCFNGNGFSIRGIYIDSDKKYQGLFGYATGTIQNVILKNSYISGGAGTGAIVGLNGGTVLNCTTENTIVNGKDSKVGGIVGISMSASAINQCYTKKGQVIGNEYVGGIVGYVNNNVSLSEASNSSKVTGKNYTGGIAGVVFYGSALHTIDNDGIVEGADNVGGIAGYSQAQMEKVYNKGDIKGERFTGGIVGINFTMGDISKSYNIGKVQGKDNVGGIVGTNNANISSVYNKGDIKADGYRAGGICGQNATDSYIYNSYNIGKVEAQEGIDGICGGNFGTITNSYYLNTILNIESENAKNEEEMKTGILENLGVEFVSDSSNINEGYPVLSWQA